VNKRQATTLASIFEKPAPHLQIKWTAVEGLIRAIGGRIEQGSGSRLKVKIGDQTAYLHTPHPHKELKSYQVKAVKELLESQGVTP